MYIAVYKDGQYAKANVVDGHVVEHNNSEEKFAEVYDLWAKTWYKIEITEEFLDSLNIPNLGYKKTNTGFEIYDTSSEEYTEEILPVYVDVFGSFKKSKKSVSLKTPTKKSVKASNAMYKKIEHELEKLKQQEDLKNIREKVESGNGIAYIKTINNLFQLLSEENIKVLFSSKGSYIVGSVAKNPILDLYVPENLIPIIIGKGGQMIKKIASEIGAKRINVKPM